MKVLVTGSEGFVAGHTIPVLEAAGHEVVRYDLKLGQDICDIEQLRGMVEPGMKILHLAAVARFPEADANPVEAYRTNVGGTATVLRVAVEKGVERVVLASTGSVYMPVWNVPVDEHHPVAGNSHYGFSKALAEKMLWLHKAPFVMLRYSHLYGKDKRHGGLIDSFVERVALGLRPVLYGGGQTSDFCNVKDVAKANLLALMTPHLGQIFNIGSGREISTRDAAEVLRKVTGYKGDFELGEARVVDAARFYYDITKARSLLGYDPQWGFEEGLRDMLMSPKEGLNEKSH